MDRKELGHLGEQAAARYLEERGYQILERNHRTPFGELDLIARFQRQLVFVEVKTRRGKGFGSPAEAITRKKQQRLRRAGSVYSQDAGWRGPLRFDAVEVRMSTGKPHITHLQGVF